MNETSSLFIIFYSLQWTMIIYQHVKSRSWWKLDQQFGEKFMTFDKSSKFTARMYVKSCQSHISNINFTVRVNLWQSRRLLWSVSHIMQPLHKIKPLNWQAIQSRVLSSTNCIVLSLSVCASDLWDFTFNISLCSTRFWIARGGDVPSDD